MKKNVFLFTGEEKYLIFQELKKWKDSFAQKYGPENIFQFNSENFNPGEILNSIFSGGLFVNRKLILIYGYPKDTDSDNKLPDGKLKVFEDKIINEIENISDDVIVVFVSFSADKRTKSFKFLNDNVVVKNFPKQNVNQKKQFVKNILGDMIDNELLSYMIDYIGGDLFLLSNEANKVKIYCEENNIKLTKDILDSVCFSHSMINSFDILDNLFKDNNKTLSIITGLQKSGADQFQFLGMLYWGFKGIINIIDVTKSGDNNSKTVASKLGLHPFVVSKNLKKIDLLRDNENKIKDMFYQTIELDYGIKTGKIPSEIFWLEVKKILMI